LLSFSSFLFSSTSLLLFRVLTCVIAPSVSLHGCHVFFCSSNQHVMPLIHLSQFCTFLARCLLLVKSCKVFLTQMLLPLLYCLFVCTITHI
jgi:hypothetical protein